MLCFLSSVFETTIIEPSSLANHPRPTAFIQASNVMIKSSLLKTSLLQCYDKELTASYVTQNSSFQSPCSLWEQEFNRYPSTVFFVSCLTAFGMSHRTAPPEPLFSVETGAQLLPMSLYGPTHTHTLRGLARQHSVVQLRLV